LDKEAFLPGEAFLSKAGQRKKIVKIFGIWLRQNIE
jgi:hypothetical protein